MINAANKTIASSPPLQKDTKWPPKDFYWGSKSSHFWNTRYNIFNRVNRAQEIVSHLNTSLSSPSVKRSQLNIFFFQLSPRDTIHYWGAIKGIWESNQQWKTDGGFCGNHKFIWGMHIKLMPFYRAFWHTSLLNLTPLIFVWQLAVHDALGLVIRSSRLRLHIWYL